MFTITTNSPEQTSLLGEKIANLIQDNLIICLEGDLGAGKTLFTQSLCKALKVKEIVTSPTFNLMNVYEGKKRIYHFDLYRLEQPEDLEEIGFYEYTDVEVSIANIATVLQLLINIFIFLTFNIDSNYTLLFTIATLDF